MKEYHKKYMPKYYEKNKVRCLEVNKKARKKRRKQRCGLIHSLFGNKCVLCESKNLLQFHHVNKETKYKNVSHLISDGVKFKTVIQEANKCILLCENCHNNIHSVMASYN